jgi:hypothetical protein
MVHPVDLLENWVGKKSGVQGQDYQSVAKQAELGLGATRIPE